MSGDQAALADLACFAALETASHDLEPWAELLAALHRSGILDTEDVLWAVKLYNAYDDLGSALSVLARWPSPKAWDAAPDRAEAAQYPCTQERRNLRGGLVLRHLADYAHQLGGLPQAVWLRMPLCGDPAADYDRLMSHLRTVWGVGRQSAFEWAEFTAKVIGLPVHASHAHLWESEGPRRSLQRLYGHPNPSPAWLDQRARVCRDWLADTGTSLIWEDFETVICDFNVMRDGRYYPGKHLASIAEELTRVPAELERAARAAWTEVIPEPWCRIAPGIDPAKLGYYRDTGAIVSAP